MMRCDIRRAWAACVFIVCVYMYDIYELIRTVCYWLSSRENTTFNWRDNKTRTYGFGIVYTMSINNN